MFGEAAVVGTNFTEHPALKYDDGWPEGKFSAHVELENVPGPLLNHETDPVGEKPITVTMQIL